MNHIKPWKLKEGTAVFILFNLQDNSKMLCLICQKVNLLLEKISNELFEILSKSDDYLEITEIMHQLKFN